MIDYEDARPLDVVPEADRVEQAQDAFRDADPDEPPFFDAANYVDEMAANIARDADTANAADVIEQTIPVPFDEGAEGFTVAEDTTEVEDY
ncbi:hypothetical protein [Nocardia camponoti]|uniref:Uncharacterized protein n=1 Tax=Nocardia camponoti TaxID=1616106 RepID=A0A917V8I9_9NOCA|nr:hypothetical protein [Nocardia camponoti]GGK50394.1 hypothetical protein GCM10011591_22420 [Nocardia camponoti]